MRHNVRLEIKKALRMKPEARRSVSAAALKNNRSDFLVERLKTFTRESHSCVIFVILLQRHNVPVNWGAGLGSFLFFFILWVNMYCWFLACKKVMRWGVFLHSWPAFESYILRGRTTLRVFWHEDTHGGCLNRGSDSCSSNESRADVQTNQLSKSLTKKSPKN